MTTRCEALRRDGAPCTLDGTMTYDLGADGLAGWPLGAPSLRLDVELLSGGVIALCIPHMRDLQTAIEMRATARRSRDRGVRPAVPFAVPQATGHISLVTELRAAAVQLGDTMTSENLAALMMAARLLASRPRLAAAWGMYLTEHTGPAEVQS